MCAIPQVWEFDKNLLQADALPCVGQYKYETATVLRGMHMDEFLPAVIQAVCEARGATDKDTENNSGDGEGEWNSRTRECECARALTHT